MTWQTETVAASDTYREFLTSLVAVATSQHVSAIVVNAGGTGHVVGDVITITHASAYHDLRIEVLTVSSGAIVTARIETGGAFSDRVASAVLGASGGSGYVIGDILQVQGGSATEEAKFEVATLSGSAVATVTLFETGGAYTSDPALTDAATLGISTGFAGDDAAVLDITMQAIIGTSAIAQSSTTGAGTGATFDLTLTASGWSTVHNENNQDWGVQPDDNDKTVVLEGTVVSGDSPIVGFASIMGDDGGAIDRHAIALFGMTAFNPSIDLTIQPNIGPLEFTVGTTEGSHLLITEEVAEGNSWWMSVTGRRIYGCVRGNVSGETDSYHMFYIGFGNQYGTTTTSPYPMFVGGSSYNWNQDTFDSAHTGLAECFQEDASRNGPVYFLRKTDLAWTEVVNGAVSTVQTSKVMWPLGMPTEATGGPNEITSDSNFRRLNSDGVLSSSIRANLSVFHYPAPGANDEFVEMPLTIADAGDSGGVNDIHTHVAGELDGCFWTGGTKEDGTAFTAEDQIEAADGTRYRIFPCNSSSIASRRYQFMLMKET